MPRSPTVLTPPPGTLPFTPNTTIESGKANAVWLDLYQDGNTPRPIAYGGTGASNAEDALNNLGGIGQSNFLGAYSIGDGYYSARDISSDGGTWLKRDGALYNSADYPVLSSLLPSLPDGVTWDINPTGSTQTFNSITYGEGRFVAVGDSGVIYVSSDRENWEPRSSGTAQNLNAVAYGAGIFVAIGVAGVRCVSPDGDNWTTGTINAGFIGLSLVYGNSLFVAGGTNNLSAHVIYTSSDASTWSAASVTGNGSVGSIAWNGVRFVAGSQGNPCPILTSTDGNTWIVNTTSYIGYFRGIATDGTNFVLVGNTGAIYTTTNGTTVVQRTSGTTNNLYGVTHSPGAGWMAVGDAGTVRISTNSTAWSTSVTGSALSLRAVTYDPNDESFYIVMGASGTSLEGQRTLPTQFRVPNDAATYGWIKAEND